MELRASFDIRNTIGMRNMLWSTVIDSRLARLRISRCHPCILGRASADAVAGPRRHERRGRCGRDYPGFRGPVLPGIALARPRQTGALARIGVTDVLFGLLDRDQGRIVGYVDRL